MADDGFGAITVMVIDDEAFWQKFVARILDAIGVGQVLVAESGAEALGQLEATTGRLDLIICDIEMPEMTGYEFVRRLRYGTVPAFKDVPVLILTGHPTEANARRARTHKVSGYITKPVTIDMLKVQIRGALGS